MSRERIGVYYSHGQDFAQVLEGVRRMHPDAEILAIVPAGYELTEREMAACDAVHVTEHARYSLVAVPAIVRLVRQIRKLDCTLFIVLFQTTQLRIFASLTGADVCQCWGVDSRIHAIDAAVSSSITSVFVRKCKGWARYIRLWLYAHFVRIRPDRGSRNA